MICYTTLFVATLLFSTNFMVCLAAHGEYIITTHRAPASMFKGPLAADATIPASITLSRIPATHDVDQTTGINYDPVQKKLYWADRKGGTIRRADVDGSNLEEVASSNDAHAVCLDIYNRVIYWTVDSTADSTIWYRSMDLAPESPPARLVGSNLGLDGLFDCAYGHKTHTLYLAYGGSNGIVKQIPIDATSSILTDKTIDSSSLEDPIAVEVDEEAGELFYGMYYPGESIRRYILPDGPATTVWTGKSSSAGFRGFSLYHDLLLCTDLRDNTNQLFTVPRSATGLTDGQETDLTTTFNGGDHDEIYNVVVTRACTDCPSCINGVSHDIDTGSQTLTITWDEPTGSCFADYFRVVATPTNVDQCDGAVESSDTIETDWQTGITNITIPDVLPNTVYTVVVTSGLELSTNPLVVNTGQSVELTATTGTAEPSGTPGLSITAATDSSVTLAFTEPPCGSVNGEILSYTYYCSNSVTLPLQGLGNTPAQFPAAVVRDIFCDIDSDYVCYAAAVTEAGTGPFVSVPLDGSISSVPTSPPCNVMILEASNSQVTFGWEQCACGTRGGITQSYTYQLLSNGQVIAFDEIEALSVTLTIPVCDGDYIFEVAVKTSAGIGPYAQKDVRSDSGLASEPLVISTNVFLNTVVVEIMDHPCILDVAVVISYVYTLRRLSPKRQTEIIRTGEIDVEEDSTTTVRLEGLDCDTTYQLLIAAKTAVGIGLETDIIFSTERSPEPFQPGSSLTITSLSSSITVISWETSLTICPSTDFEVSYRLSNLEQCEIKILDTWARVSTRDSEITLHNLHGGSTYVISVTSETPGADSTLQTTWITPESPPRLAPGNVHAVYYNSLELVIEWEPPLCGTRGGVISYEYELIAVSDQPDVAVYSDVTLNNRIKITPPAGYVQYYFRVATVNSAGFIYSDNINIVPGDVPTVAAPSVGLCVDILCLNGGTCLPDLTNGEGFCRCQAGYSGDRCEVTDKNGLDDGSITAIAVAGSIFALVTTIGLISCLYRLIRGRQRATQQPLQPAGIDSNNYTSENVGQMQMVPFSELTVPEYGLPNRFSY